MNKFRIASFKTDFINLIPKDINADGFEFGFDVGFSESESNTFIVKFKVTVFSLAGYELTIEYTSFFETEEPITDDFKDSDFIKINAPAIAYPFLRSFISILTLNAGYEPVLIPTINFQELVHENNKLVDD